MWDFLLFGGILSLLLILLYFISGMVYGDFMANAFNTNLPHMVDDFRRRLVAVTQLPSGAPTAVPTSVPSAHPRGQHWFLKALPGMINTLPFAFWTLAGIEVVTVCAGEVAEVFLPSM